MSTPPPSPSTLFFERQGGKVGERKKFDQHVKTRETLGPWRNPRSAVFHLLRALERFKGLVLYVTSVRRSPSPGSFTGFQEEDVPEENREGPLFVLANQRFEPQTYREPQELQEPQCRRQCYLTLNFFFAVVSSCLEDGGDGYSFRLLLRFPSPTLLRHLVQTGMWKRMVAVPFFNLRCQVLRAPSPSFFSSSLSSPETRAQVDVALGIDGHDASSATASQQTSQQPSQLPSQLPWRVLVNSFAPEFPEARFVVLSLSRQARDASRQEAYQQKEKAMEDQIRKTVGPGFLGRKKFVSAATSPPNSGRSDPVESPSYLALTFFRSYGDILRWRYEAQHVRTKAMALPCQWYQEYEIMVTEVREVYGFRPPPRVLP
jgi:hypothetical protein